MQGMLTVTITGLKTGTGSQEHCQVGGAPPRSGNHKCRIAVGSSLLFQVCPGIDECLNRLLRWSMPSSQIEWRVPLLAKGAREY